MEEAALASKQHDLPREYLRNIRAADSEDVSRPDGGEHAGSGDLQAYFTKRPHYFRGEAAPYRRAGIRHWIHRREPALSSSG